MHFPIVWCAVYIHFSACTNLQRIIGLGWILKGASRGGGGGGGKDTIFLAESAIFYPYTVHGVFGKVILGLCLLLFADTVSLGEVLPIK